MKLFSFALCLALVPVAAHADAMSDQQKAYKMMGIHIPHPPAMCGLISKGEAARFLGTPVRDGESAGPLSGCAYHSVTDPNVGLLVTRDKRDSWYPPTNDKGYAAIHGVGERAYTMFNAGLGYEATALNAKGVTSIQLAGKGSASTAIGLLRIAMNR
jgi:hypothetical protein